MGIEAGAVAAVGKISIHSTIVRTPTMRTDTPQTIYRKDYTAPTYQVETVELGFDLDPARTIVANRMTMQRNPDSVRRDIELVGEDIELVAIRLNGKTLDEGAYAIEGTV